MNYTANIQNFLEKNEMHCIFSFRNPLNLQRAAFLILPIEIRCKEDNIHIR